MGLIGVVRVVVDDENKDDENENGGGGGGGSIGNDSCSDDENEDRRNDARRHHQDLEFHPIRFERSWIQSSLGGGRDRDRDHTGLVVVDDDDDDDYVDVASGALPADDLYDFPSGALVIAGPGFSRRGGSKIREMLLTTTRTTTTMASPSPSLSTSISSAIRETHDDIDHYGVGVDCVDGESSFSRD